MTKKLIKHCSKYNPTSKLLDLAQACESQPIGHEARENDFVAIYRRDLRRLLGIAAAAIVVFSENMEAAGLRQLGEALETMEMK